MEGGEVSNQILQGVKSLVLVFVASILAQLMVMGDSVLSADWSEWKAIVSPAVAAVIVFAYNFLSPYDKRYGVGAE